LSERQRFGSGTPWEALAGYSRAVRLGAFVWVSGTTASDASGAVQGEDAAAQTRYILTKIEAALGEVGASLTDVVRTRIYVARLEDWEAVARVHGEVFGPIRPANTLVQVAGLVGGRLVEIEADAVIS
jgi:enamine deaminase RidA (YjgF/YER057c/UK114 family)